jgi:uncharacterized protein (TIGR03435 family)
MPGRLSRARLLICAARFPLPRLFAFLKPFGSFGSFEAFESFDSFTRASLRAAQCPRSDMRVLLAVLLSLLYLALSPPSIVIEAQATRETFEVASVKINRSNSMERPVIRLSPTGLDATNATVVDLIQHAFEVLNKEVVGELPGWARTTRFDVAARTASGPLPRSRLMAMARALLEERFRLDASYERAQGPVYAMVMNGKPEQFPVKQGRGLRPAESKCVVDPVPRPFDPTPTREVYRSGNCGFTSAFDRSGLQYLGGRGITMQQFARELTRAGSFDRPVVDQTGVTGEFDVVVAPTPDMAGPELGGARAYSEFRFLTALREQLGLELRGEQGLFDVLRVRRVAQPSPN